MVIFLDIKNKEVIEITSTKASDLLYKNKEYFSLVSIASVHSSQKMNIDLTSIGFNQTISAANYIKKYNLKEPNKE